jgi:hypothetical protein
MKKYVRFFFLLSLGAFCLLSSCSKEDSPYAYNDPTIYSESNKTLFSEIVFFVRPYVVENGLKKYIVADTLKNISLKINNIIEKNANSYALDVDHLYSKEIAGDYLVTEQTIHYPVVVGVTMIPENLTTAGQYADLLNDYLNLQPGVYVCQIVSFDVQTASGTLRTIYTPTLSFPLEVKENIASVNLGEFEVEVN